MEEDEDDFYGGASGARQEPGSTDNYAGAPVKAERMDTGGDEGDEEEDDDDDSDDDVQFTLEKPEGIKTEPLTASKPQPKQQDRTASTEAIRPAKSTATVKQERPGSTAPPAAVKGSLTHDGKEGKEFPAVRSSNIDVNADPVWRSNGKPITEIDIDADLAELSKPWRLPGTDQTDYFNYGFDEYSWTQYCVRQQTMSSTISDQKQIDAQMKAFFGGGGNGPAPGGAMPGMPPGMPMPDPQQMMEMVNAGIIPPEFAQMIQMGGMPGMPGGGQGMNQPNGGFGMGQNSISPQPMSGQGFQPPSGPAAGQQGAQGGFPNGGMEGYSQQQAAIMQQEQQGQMMGGGRRGRRGRGGFYQG